MKSNLSFRAIIDASSAGEVLVLTQGSGIDLAAYVARTGAERLKEMMEGRIATRIIIVSREGACLADAQE